MGSVRASNGFSSTPRDGNEAIIGKLKDIERRLRAVERPSGTQIAQLVQQVQDQLATIDATVVASISANSYTQAQIDARDTNTYNAAVAAFSAGFTASGGISASDLYTRNGPGVNITATRVTSWLQSSDGRIGTATSSQRYKMNIRDANLKDKARTILAISLKYYNYIEEIAKRDDPKSPNYVGEEYHVHLELGMIAEELHKAGLWEFVIYERDPIYSLTKNRGGENVEEVCGDILRLDEKGEPIPFSIHYHLFGMAVLAAAQYLDERLTIVEDDLQAIKNRLGL